MREFKFRVWDKENKRFFDTGGLSFGLRKHEFFIEDGGKTFNDCIIQQFTGLLDINGKEIYEGDIVKFLIAPNMKIKIGKIFYLENSFEVESEKEYFSPCSLKIVKREIIGNIFENPELIEKK